MSCNCDEQLDTLESIAGSLISLNQSGRLPQRPTVPGTNGQIVYWNSVDARYEASTSYLLSSIGVSSVNAATGAVVLTVANSGTAGALQWSGTQLQIPTSDTDTTGLLTSTDWTTFNNKQPAGNYITALTGDATASGPGSVAITLATVNSNVGSFGSASSVSTFTVNGKGLLTAAGSTAIQITESQVTNLVSDLAGKQPVGNYITALTGDATASGPGSVALTLATVNTNVGSFGSASNVATLTVNGKGLITAASNTPIQITESQVTNLVSDLAAKLSSTLASANIFVGSVGNVATAQSLTLSASSGAFSLSNAGVLTFPDASASARGLMNTGTQTITGIKTFDTRVNVGTSSSTGTILSVEGTRGTVTVTNNGQTLNITTTASSQDNEIIMTSPASTLSRNRIRFVQGTSQFSIGWGRPANANPVYFYYGFSGSSTDGATIGIPGFRFGLTNSDFAWGFVDNVANVNKFDFQCSSNTNTGGLGIWNSTGVAGSSIRFWLDTTGASANAIIGHNTTTAISIASTGVVTLSQGLTMADAKNIVLNTTTGTKIGTATGQKIGFWNATPVIQQVLSAYTTDPENSAYSGIDNAQAGSVYAQLTDLNALRAAYENLRAAYDDLRTKLQTTGILG